MAEQDKQNMEKALSDAVRFERQAAETSDPIYKQKLLITAQERFNAALFDEKLFLAGVP